MQIETLKYILYFDKSKLCQSVFASQSWNTFLVWRCDPRERSLLRQVNVLSTNKCTSGRSLAWLTWGAVRIKRKRMIIRFSKKGSQNIFFIIFTCFSEKWTLPLWCWIYEVSNKHVQINGFYFIQKCCLNISYCPNITEQGYSKQIHFIET